MRGDQSVVRAAAPTVSASIAANLSRPVSRLPTLCSPTVSGGAVHGPPPFVGSTHRPRQPTKREEHAPICNVTVPISYFRRAAVRRGRPGRRPRRRDLDDRRLVGGGHPVHRPRDEAGLAAARAAGANERLRARAAVAVFEAYDVVELRRRDLEDRRVLERGHPVHRPGDEAERGAGADLVLGERGAALFAELDLRTAGVDEPRLVLLAVELERERVTRLHEQELAAVDVRQGPDQLVAPRLLDPARSERPRAEAAHTRSHSGCELRCSAALRSSFGVFTVSHSPSWRNARNRRSATSSGNVVVSWSPFSGKRSTTSSEKT